jgi:hypothetical protein
LAARRATFTPPPLGAKSRASAASDGAEPKGRGPAIDRLIPEPLRRQIDQAPAWLRPILVVLLAAAILLLGIAAAPQRVIVGPRALSVIEQRRLELALTGIAIVIAVAIGAILS